MQTEYLVDTNVISQSYKSGDKAAKTKSWIIENQSNIRFSVITIAELYKGALEKKRSNRQLSELLYARVDQIADQYADAIVSIDQDVAFEWANLMFQNPGRKKVLDALIAATAIVYGLHLATFNEKDFRDYPGIQLVNPLK